jgi:riboflavin biosynthesis pyrimidine reductase
VSSADGRASINGGSTGLGDSGDREIFRALRGCADAVLVGTGTLRAENYNLLASVPEVRELRARLGLAAQPIACTVTRSGAIPTDIPLLQAPDARIVAVSGGDIDLSGVRASVEVVRLPAADVTVSAALRHLRAHHGVRLLLCEGGPTVFDQMVTEQVIDELFLTLAPKLAGGAGTGILNGPALPGTVGMRLEWVLEQGSSLFVRYAIEN